LFFFVKKHKRFFSSKKMLTVANVKIFGGRKLSKYRKNIKNARFVTFMRLGRAPSLKNAFALLTGPFWLVFLETQK